MANNLEILAANTRHVRNVIAHIDYPLMATDFHGRSGLKLRFKIPALQVYQILDLLAESGKVVKYNDGHGEVFLSSKEWRRLIVEASPVERQWLESMLVKPMEKAARELSRGRVDVVSELVV